MSLYVTRPPQQNSGRLTTSLTLHDGLELVRANRAGEPAAAAAIARLASEFGTPLYVYDGATILSQLAAVKTAFAPRFSRLKIHYALKANTNAAIVKLLVDAGAGAEVVSLGEILTARRVGVRAAEILFSSSSKRPVEIRYAVTNDVLLNIDSLDELEQVSRTAEELSKTARLSIRINPDIDPHTLHQIATGISEAKFGVPLDGGLAVAAYERATRLPGLSVIGVHAHIGSQIADPAGHVATARKLLALAKELKERLGLTLEFVDVGGGLGIPYRDGERVMSPEELARELKPVWEEGIAALTYEPSLWIEPGRFFVGPAGLLVARVNSVKRTAVKTFVNVDAGFNTLMRPSMYGAYHRVRAAGRSADPETVDVAGDVCETGDILGSERFLPRVFAGDLLVFLDAGAYGFAMTSEYNARPLPAEVLVDGDAVTVIRRRGTYDDLFRSQVLPGGAT